MSDMTVYEAITEVSKTIGSLAKEGFNEHQRYSFRGIDQLVTAVQPVLNEVGVNIIPQVLSHHSEDRITDKNIQRWCTVEVKYTIVGPAGDSVNAIMVGEATDTSDKAMNKAMSNAAKYFYFQTFWFGIGGMDDGDLDHIEGGAPQSAPRSAPQAAPQATPRPQPQSRPAGNATAGGGATEPQQKKIWAMAHKTLNWDDVRMFQQIEVATGQKMPDLASLTKSDASKVIEYFQSAIDNGTANEVEPQVFEEF